MVRIEKVDPANPDPRIIKLGADLLLKNEVIVCPTDTGYAFGANAVNETAIERVFCLKGRSFDNPIHITVSSMKEARKYAVVNRTAEFLMRRFLPGGLTLVLPRKDTVPGRLVGGRNTVGIRIPDNKSILGLAKLSGVPITSTSANISGQPTPYNIPEILKQLGKDAEKLALVIDQGPLPQEGLSTIIDLTTPTLKLIRAGVIPLSVIEKALSSRSSN